MMFLFLLWFLACTHPVVSPPASAPVSVATPGPQPTVRVAPGLQPGRPFTPPTPQETVLRNGIYIVLMENHEVPMVWMQLVEDAGSWSDPEGKEGLSLATMAMLTRGADGLSAEDISHSLRILASEVDASAGLDSVQISASCLRRNLEPTLDILAKVVTAPDFPEREWAILQDQLLAARREESDNPSATADHVFDRVMYGAAYAGMFPTETSISSITARDIQDWYMDHMVSTGALFLVGGDVTLEEIKPMIESRFGGWVASTSGDPPIPTAIQPDALRLYLVDQPGAVQSTIRIGRFANQRTDVDWFHLMVGVQAFGGTFTSRLVQQLREEQGVTYQISSYLSPSHAPALWTVATSVETGRTVEAIRAILDEIRGLVSDRPLSEEEVDRVRNYLAWSYPARFERTGFTLAQTAEMRRYGLPDDWISAWPDNVRKVAPEQANKALRRWIDPSRLAIVVVGDKAVIGPGLETLGIPLFEMNRDGEPVGE